MSEDTIRRGSRLVVYGTIPIPYQIRDKILYTYDLELTLLMVEGWIKGGMTRDEVYDFLIETEMPLDS